MRAGVLRRDGAVHDVTKIVDDHRGWQTRQLRLLTIAQNELHAGILNRALDEIGSCGGVQYPAHILKTELSPEECFQAVEECGTPMVSIPGGEPLMHSEIDKIVEGLVARKKYIYLCTNALLLKEKLPLFKPSKYLTFSVHVDGQKEHHDFSVCREGGYEQAIEGIREAIKQGFRVTTNTTLFDGADPKSVRAFFDEMMELGVEGMMLSPGYS